MRGSLFAILNKDVREVIITIGRMADQQHISAYLVGGIVRDCFLKRENFDIDIVVEADAIAFAKEISKGRNSRLICHKRFGTATFLWPNGLRIDLASARKERYPFSGSLPVVSKSVIRDDLFRRDFTVNAIAVGITPRRFGELVDFFGGIEDIRTERIRILHDKSFIDDPTRILRALRFEQRFGFRIERKTRRFLKQALQEDVICNVKPPRFFEEFKKIFLEPYPDKCIKRLGDLEGLKFLGDGVQCGQKMFRLLTSIRQNIAWFKRKFSTQKDLDTWLPYFLGLTSGISEDEKERVSKHLQLRRVDRKKLLASHQVQQEIRRLSARRMRPDEVFRILHPVSYEVIVFMKSKSSSEIVKKRIDDFLVKYDSVKLHINGEDLRSLGVSNGQKIRNILTILLYRKINGGLQSRQQEVQYAKKLISSCK